MDTTAQEMAGELNRDDRAHGSSPQVEFLVLGFLRNRLDDVRDVELLLQPVGREPVIRVPRSDEVEESQVRALWKEIKQKCSFDLVARIRVKVNDALFVFSVRILKKRNIQIAFVYFPFFGFFLGKCFKKQSFFLTWKTWFLGLPFFVERLDVYLFLFEKIS